MPITHWQLKATLKRMKLIFKIFHPYFAKGKVNKNLLKPTNHRVMPLPPEGDAKAPHLHWWHCSYDVLRAETSRHWWYGRAAPADLAKSVGIGEKKNVTDFVEILGDPKLFQTSLTSLWKWSISVCALEVKRFGKEIHYNIFFLFMEKVRGHQADVLNGREAH